MKFLYKFFIRNEQEIRQDLPARTTFVAADSMSDAVNGYIDCNSLVQSVEFVSPVLVVPSKSESSSPSSSSSSSLYRICHVFYRVDEETRSALIHADDTSSAISHLCVFLGYTPEIVQSYMISDLIL